MSRKNGGNKSTRIEIEIDLDEADKRECIGTATYQEIKVKCYNKVVTGVVIRYNNITKKRGTYYAAKLHT